MYNILTLRSFFLPMAIFIGFNSLAFAQSQQTKDNAVAKRSQSTHSEESSPPTQISEDQNNPSNPSEQQQVTEAQYASTNEDNTPSQSILALDIARPSAMMPGNGSAEG